MSKNSLFPRILIFLAVAFCIGLLIVNSNYRRKNYIYEHKLSYYQEYENIQVNSLGSLLFSPINQDSMQWRIYYNFANAKLSFTLSELDSLNNWMNKYFNFDVLISGDFDEYLIKHIKENKKLSHKIIKMEKPDNLTCGTRASVYIINTEGTCVYNWVLDEEEANKSLLHLEAFRRLHNSNSVCIH